MLNKKESLNKYYRIAIIGSDDDSLSEFDKQRLFPICYEIGKLLAENNKRPTAYKLYTGELPPESSRMV